MTSQAVPFTIDLLGQHPSGQSASGPIGSFPALYYSPETRSIKAPGDAPADFLEKELSLARLEKIDKHLWFAGNKRPTASLHYQICIGRRIVLTERMDLHLLWSNNGTLYIKPLSQHLLDSSVWKNYLTCPPSNITNGSGTQAGSGSTDCIQKQLRECALGFLFSYACLILSYTDFQIALDQHLIPKKENGSDPSWQDWKKFAQEVVKAGQNEAIHKRFYRGELRLDRLNTIHRFTQLPLFDPYLRSWRHYGDLFHDNVAFMATATVFIALILTAMQVGLGVEPLKNNQSLCIVRIHCFRHGLPTGSLGLGLDGGLV